jgi:hypothetical protein
MKDMNSLYIICTLHEGRAATGTTTGGAGIVVLGGSESSSILVQKSGLF